jgi:hypothetical protein
MGDHQPIMGDHQPIMGDHQPIMGNHQLTMGNHQLTMGNHQLTMGNHQLTMGNHQLTMGNHQLTMRNHQLTMRNHQLTMGNHQLTMSFNMHVDYVCNKLSRSLFCLNRLKNFVRQKALIQVYHALFNSHLLCCINILGSTSMQNIKRIQVMQKKLYELSVILNIMNTRRCIFTIWEYYHSINN